MTNRHLVMKKVHKQQQINNKDQLSKMTIAAPSPKSGSSHARKRVYKSSKKSEAQHEDSSQSEAAQGLVHEKVYITNEERIARHQEKKAEVLRKVHAQQAQ